MAAQANLESTSITNLNASPVVRRDAGKNGRGVLWSCDDSVAALTTGATSGGILRMVRIPSNCFVKEVYWKVNATVTTASCDVGLYYSNTRDGTTAANVAAADTAIDADFFASAVVMTTQSTLGWTPITFESGTYTAAKLRPVFSATAS